MSEAMSDERIEHIGILLSAPDVGGVAQVIARELLAELKRARAQLAETVAVHARCPDLYVGGAGPKGAIEVFPEYEEGEWE